MRVPPPSDRPPRLPGDPQDHRADGEPDERVGQGEAQRDHPRAGHDTQRDVRVSTGMGAVGYKGVALEPATGTGADQRGDPVAREPERPSRRERQQVLDVLGREQSVHSLVAGDAGADEDGRDDRQPRPTLRLGAPKRESDPQRDRGGRVAGVVDQIGEQRDLPEAEKTTTWTPAVSPSTSSAQATARRPARERLIEASTSPCVWAWAWCSIPSADRDRSGRSRWRWVP